MAAGTEGTVEELGLPELTHDARNNQIRSIR